MSALPRIVLDTNLLVAAIGRQSPLRWLFDVIVEERVVLCVSTAILLEYEEVLARKASPEVARNVLNFMATAPNVEWVEPRFRWRLITADPDDDKFVDVTLAAGADALVTHDRHFDLLRSLDFPPVRLLKAQSLQDLLYHRR